MADFSRCELCELRKRLLEPCEGEPPLPPPEKWLDHELELVRETLYFIMQFRSVGNRDVLAKCIGVLACLRTNVGAALRQLHQQEPYVERVRFRPARARD